MKTLSVPKPIQTNYKAISVIVLLLVFSNALTYRLGIGGASRTTAVNGSEQLYLLDKARTYMYDTETFAQKVQSVARNLSIPAEWLMAVMYAESRFNASAQNHKGSGAVGLIQFMPATLADLHISSQQLQNMNPTEQLVFVERYLQQVQQARGTYQSLTDLYLGILYPDALGEEPCYTLYAQPQVNYTQNSGLDEDKDGKVTVSDVDRFLRRIYPTAYHTTKQSDGWF